MILRVDTGRLRRILSASLPTGARGAEMFAESRVSLHVAVAGDPGAPPSRVERRSETGAHLRRFSEGRLESFVLDAPSPEALEALVLHPEAIAVEWLKGRASLGLNPSSDTPERLEATLADGSPGASGGPWSRTEAALDRARSALAFLGSLAEGTVPSMAASVTLEAHVQEVLVLATDRDVARDTRAFAGLTLRVAARGEEPSIACEETLGGPAMESLAEEHVSAAARRLVDRAARSAGPCASPRGEMPVVFAPPSGGFLLHEVCGHLLEADHVLRSASPFVGARGQAVASPLLTLADDGSAPCMRGSMRFDDEGAAARRTPLIMEGTLVGYLSDRLTAHATDGISSGNGRRESYRDAPMPRMTNLVIDAAGSGRLEEIVAHTSSGLLVTRLGRGRVDPSSGRFALGVEEGFLIEGGRPGAPVYGTVLRGDARALLLAIDAVGGDATVDTGAPLCVKDDQAIPFGIRQPTLRVARMLVSGGEA